MPPNVRNETSQPSRNELNVYELAFGGIFAIIIFAMWVHHYSIPVTRKLITCALATSMVAYLGRMPRIMDIDTIWQEPNSSSSVQRLDLFQRAVPKKIYADWWASTRSERDCLINSGPPSSTW